MSGAVTSVRETVTHADGGGPSGSHRGRKAGSHKESHQPGASSVGLGVV